MTRRPGSRLVVAVAATLLALAALAPVGVTAAPAGAARAAADASPAAPLIPAGCPDVTDGRVALDTIIATGAAKMIECMHAAGTYMLEFEAYFPSFICQGCGGMGGASIDPAWLSGGIVDYDAATRVVTPTTLSQLGMRVATGPEPALLGDDAAHAWTAANELDLRLPPGVGSCSTQGTSPSFCTVSRYADQYLRFTAHYEDPAAATCTGHYRPSPSTFDYRDIPKASATAFCDRQLVVDSFVVTQAHVCPSAPYTVGQLSHFTSERLVACLGSRAISVTAYVPAPQAVGIGGIWAGRPGWLVDNGAVGMVVANGNEIGSVDWLVRVPPKLGACELTADQPASCPFRPFGGKWVRIAGHFADPFSATCRATWTSPAPKPRYFTADYVHQYCREQFVISANPVAAKPPKNP